MNPIADRIHAQVERLRVVRERAERLEREHALAVKEVERIEEIVLPELLEDVGTDVYRLPDGCELVVQRDVLAGILVSARDEAHEWLERHNHGAMIQRTLVVDFEKGETKTVEEIKRKLVKAGFDVKTEIKVNPSTLRAWARRRSKDGEAIPDSISVTPREWVVVK